MLQHEDAGHNRLGRDRQNASAGDHDQRFQTGRLSEACALIDFRLGVGGAVLILTSVIGLETMIGIPSARARFLSSSAPASHQTFLIVW